MKKSKRPLLLALLFILSLTACVSADSESPVTTLTLATLYPEKIDRSAVDRFNRTHKDAKIEILDYSSEDASNSKSGRDRLFTAAAAGQTPDIIDLTGLSYRTLARKGYLEDLWPYIESDPELGREGVWETPLKAAEIDGKLYEVFNYVNVDTLVGAESVVGDRTSWTLAELREAFSAMPEGSTVGEYCAVKTDMFPYMFKMRLDSYVDWETGQCFFDKGDFRAALEFVNSFPAEFDSSGEDVNEEIAKRLLSGRQLVGSCVLNRLLQIQILDAVYGCGGRASFVGYPIEDGSIGSSFYFTFSDRRLAMSADCRDKEAAWEFIRELLLPRYDGMIDKRISASWPRGIPVNRADYERLIQIDMSNAAREESRSMYGLPAIRCRPATAEERIRYEGFLNRIDKIQIYDDALYNIVYEQAGPYFAGDKSLDETVELIQRRAQLYVNENQ